MNYLATQRYSSSYLPGGISPGEVINLTEEEFADINRDAPGTLVTNPSGVKAPPENRKVSEPPQRRDQKGQGETIDKTTYKAVRG